jgi:hypothetical protein
VSIVLARRIKLAVSASTSLSLLMIFWRPTSYNFTLFSASKRSFWRASTWLRRVLFDSRSLFCSLVHNWRCCSCPAAHLHQRIVFWEPKICVIKPYYLKKQEKILCVFI